MGLGGGRAMDSVAKTGLKNIDELVASTKVLLVDDDYHMRKVIRSLLARGRHQGCA